MTVGGSITAAIAYIVQYEIGVGRTTIANKIAAQRDAHLSKFPQPDPVTGKRANYQRFEGGQRRQPRPRPGKYKPAPLASNTTMHVQIVQAGMRISSAIAGTCPST